MLIISSSFQYSFAQTGTLDSSLNGNGILSNNREIIFAVQSDGKLLNGEEYYDFGLGKYVSKINRFNINGSPDSSFGNNGFVLSDLQNSYMYSSRIKLCPDGKIMVLAGAGQYLYSMSRYFPDGRIDSSFNTTGKLFLNFLAYNNIVNALAIQNDGKILLAGSVKIDSHLSSFFITRLKTDGSIDLGFGGSGSIKTIFSTHISNPLNGMFYDDRSSVNGLVIQNDGKIIAAGIQSTILNGVTADSIAIVRYNSDGALDNSFNGNGKLTINPAIHSNLTPQYGSRANAVALQPDGKILVGVNLSYFQSHGRWTSGTSGVLRLNVNGSLDQTFNGNGVKSITGGNSNNNCIEIALQSDGKILVAGITGNVDFLAIQFLMARINSNGNIDNSFGQGGVVIPYPSRSGVDAMQLKGQRIYCRLYTTSASGSGLFAFKNDGTGLNPQNIRMCHLGNSLVNADLSGAIYQWQMSTDSIQFNNIINGSNFTGVNTATLSFTNIPASWRGYQFRCIVDGGSSNITTIHFSNEWTGAVSNEWENSANWLCGTVPGSFEDVIINGGNVIINSNVTINSLLVRPGATLTVGGGYALTVLH